MTRVRASAVVTVQGAKTGDRVTGVFAADRAFDPRQPVRAGDEVSAAIGTNGSAKLERDLSLDIENGEGSFWFRVARIERLRKGGRGAGEPGYALAEASAGALEWVRKSVIEKLEPEKQAETALPAWLKVSAGGNKLGLPKKKNGVLYVTLEHEDGKPVGGARVIAKRRRLKKSGNRWRPDGDWKVLDELAETICPGTYEARVGGMFQLGIESVGKGDLECRLLERTAWAYNQSVASGYSPSGDDPVRRLTGLWSKKGDQSSRLELVESRRRA